MDNRTVKISMPFKIFLALLCIAGLIAYGHLLLKAGQSLRMVILNIVMVAGAIVLVVWVPLMLMTAVNKARYTPEKMSATEHAYADDLKNFKIMATIKKYIFSDMNMDELFNSIVVAGGALRMAFFWMFTAITVISFIKNYNILNKIVYLSLSVVWCPWIENLFLKKFNFKIVFLIKLLITIFIIAVGVRIGGSVGQKLL